MFTQLVKYAYKFLTKLDRDQKILWASTVSNQCEDLREILKEERFSEIRKFVTLDIPEID